MPTAPKLTDAERADLLEYWHFLETHRAAMSEDMRAQVEQHPVLKRMTEGVTPAQRAEQEKRSIDNQRRALVEGDWGAYLADLSAMGERYAQMGIDFATWFEV